MVFSWRALASQKNVPLPWSDPDCHPWSSPSSQIHLHSVRTSPDFCTFQTDSVTWKAHPPSFPLEDKLGRLLWPQLEKIKLFSITSLSCRYNDYSTCHIKYNCVCLLVTLPHQTAKLWNKEMRSVQGRGWCRIEAPYTGCLLFFPVLNQMSFLCNSHSKEESK